MRTALVCGVSGQDGAYLAKLLLEKGYRVFGTSRDAQVANFVNLERLSITDQVERESMVLTDFRSALQTIAKVKPNEIYNLSGQSSVALSFEQPVETMDSISVGTLNLLEAVRFLGSDIRVYNASSSECFGDTGANAATEQTPFHPRSPYAVAKAAAHWAVANYRDAYGLFASNGILFNHESPLRPERFVTQKIVRAACRIRVGGQSPVKLGNLAIRRDWGWAPEYVEAMWRILQQPKADDFVVATGSAYSLADFTATAFGELGLNWRDHVELDEKLQRPSDIICSKGNAAKAHAELGWKSSYAMPDVVRMMVQAELNDGEAGVTTNCAHVELTRNCADYRNK
jgi:GDPmannose 4,6-dehydratase